MSPVTAETNDDHTTQLAGVAADIARRRYGPLAAGWDADRQAFPLEERRYLGAQGLLGICLPEHLGGAGAPLMDALIVIEELAKECRRLPSRCSRPTPARPGSCP